MSDFSYYLVEPCELVAIVYGSDGITELGGYSFRGYIKGMDHFFRISDLFAFEMSYLGQVELHEKNIVFETFSNVLRSSFYWEIEKGLARTLEDVVNRYIEELKQYKFMTQRLHPFLPKSSITTSADLKEVEITIDRIFKWIQKMRQHRIIFYERVLQEYTARQDQYNLRLREYLENNDNKEKSVSKSVEFSIDSVLSELGIDSENHSNDGLPKTHYDIHSQSWYLKDLMKLENPDIERYTKSYEELPRYRTGEIHTHPEGLRAFFELFFVFKDEMSLILPDNPDESFFEKVLTVLIRDFINDFKRKGDLEDIIVEYIEELEKFEFLSLSKEQFFDKLSKMIYDLRTRRIAFYEAVLEDYLANKEKYDKNMEIKTLKYIP